MMRGRGAIETTAHYCGTSPRMIDERHAGMMTLFSTYADLATGRMARLDVTGSTPFDRSFWIAT